MKHSPSSQEMSCILIDTYGKLDGDYVFDIYQIRLRQRKWKIFCYNISVRS